MEPAERVRQVGEIVGRWRAEGVRFVRFELPDMHGVSRSKLVPIDSVEHYSANGLNMYGGTVVLDSRSDVVPGTLYNEEIGYADQLLWPDPATAALVPWVPGHARFLCDTTWTDGQPLEAAPRAVLARVLARLAEQGVEPLVGIEYEFYLLDPVTRDPLFRGYHIFNTIRNIWVPTVERIIEEVSKVGIDVITANCEYAGSQWEINYRPKRAMEAADTAYTFKNAVKEIAHQDGFLATFMSKPFGDSAGSGAHTHLSLIDDKGTNVLFDPAADLGLSATGQHFLAGMLEYARAVDALIAPTVNCLRRRRRHSFSPTNVSWGPEDRSALVRLKGAHTPSVHFENRAPSAMANPYLVLAGILAGGLVGLEQQLQLSPAASSPAEDDASCPRLPRALSESLANLEASKELRGMLGEEFVTAYLAMRRHELDRFDDAVSEWEREEYLEIH